MMRRKRPWWSRLLSICPLLRRRRRIKIRSKSRINQIKKIRKRKKTSLIVQLKRQKIKKKKLRKKSRQY